AISAASAAGCGAGLRPAGPRPAPGLAAFAGGGAGGGMQGTDGICANADGITSRDTIKSFMVREHLKLQQIYCNFPLKKRSGTCGALLLLLRGRRRLL